MGVGGRGGSGELGLCRGLGGPSGKYHWLYSWLTEVDSDRDKRRSEDEEDGKRKCGCEVG